nr:tRNA(Ile)(2)-agmatinylcytidine synthase [Halovenus rubra]
MCTTYVATRLAERLATEGHVERTLLVRLNPAVEHKTRGNAALAIHCDVAPERALELGETALEHAAIDDDQTNPGLVVAAGEPETVPDTVREFAADAIHKKHDRGTAMALASRLGYAVRSRANGRGVIGALAAVGAWQAFDEWSYECISYRERKQWGTDREVEYDSLFEAADEGYPAVWDTVDRGENEAVCVPRTPCPILHGIRGDSPDAVRDVARAIESEPVDRRHMFVTNQGTDTHLQSGSVSTVSEDGAYRLPAEVVGPPKTREGGHVFFTVAEPGDDDSETKHLDVAAFEPTKRFRDHVRTLRVGDRLTICGEVSDQTLKLEKFAVRDLVETEQVTPDCPDCGNSMKSAGRNAGYRCRDCTTSRDGKVCRDLNRTLNHGWYEVPPCARRHIAKPLVRGGFDAPTHPER